MRHLCTALGLRQHGEDDITLVLARIRFDPEPAWDPVAGRLGAHGITRTIQDATARQALARHKVPTVIHFVPALDISASGKLARPYA